MFQSIWRLARSGGTRGRRAEQVLLHPHLPKLQGSVVDDLPVEVLQLRRAAIRKSLPNPSAQGAAFAMMRTGGGEDHAEMRSAWRRWKDDDRRAWMRRPSRSRRGKARPGPGPPGRCKASRCPSARRRSDDSGPAPGRRRAKPNTTEPGTPTLARCGLGPRCAPRIRYWGLVVWWM